MPKKLRPIATKHRSSSENDAVAKITGWVADFKPRLSCLKKSIDANVRQTKIARALPASARRSARLRELLANAKRYKWEADLLRREFRRLTGAIRTFQATARAKAKTDILLSEASAIARDAEFKAIDFRGEPSTDRERVIRAEMLCNAEGENTRRGPDAIVAALYALLPIDAGADDEDAPVPMGSDLRDAIERAMDGSTALVERERLAGIRRLYDTAVRTIDRSAEESK